MTMLSRTELKERILARPPLMENMINADTQIQPNSIEMTVRQIRTIEGPGAVDFDNSCRSIPDGKDLKFDAEGWAHLEVGIYKVLFNEIVNIPKDLAALARPRSSLIRCGVTLGVAVWDTGYSGRSECLIIVHNPGGFQIKKNARIMQLVFFHLHSQLEDGYCGIYQNENI